MITFAILLSMCRSLAAGQQPDCRIKAAEQRKAVGQERRPELGVHYSKIVDFKLSSHKKRYRAGELISIDLAIFNKAKFPIFIDKLWYAELDVSNQGRSDLYRPYLIVERVPSSGPSYQFLEPGRYHAEVIHIHAGCDDRIYKQRNKLSDESVGDREAFDQDLFVDWGRGCVIFTKPGRYVFKASVSNSQVVEPPCEPEAQTAVGGAESAPLVLTIDR